MTDPSPSEPGYYWIRLGKNPPEVAHLHDGMWAVCGTDVQWPVDAVEVLSGRLVLRSLRAVT